MSFEAAAGGVLCRAFHADPVFVWAVPDETARRVLLLDWFTGMVRWGLKFGDVKYLGPDAKPKAVAIWGARPATLIEHVKAGLLGPTFNLGVGALIRLLRLSSALSDNHRALCPEEHRYLYFLGVDPPHQRKGLGSELLEPSIADADEKGFACYLETATEANVQFYSRLRFKTAWEGVVVSGSPHLWLLKRPPRST